MAGRPEPDVASLYSHRRKEKPGGGGTKRNGIRKDDAEKGESGVIGGMGCEIQQRNKKIGLYVFFPSVCL
jgi:hypothetical protein